MSPEPSEDELIEKELAEQDGDLEEIESNLSFEDVVSRMNELAKAEVAGDSLEELDREFPLDKNDSLLNEGEIAGDMEAEAGKEPEDETLENGTKVVVENVIEDGDAFETNQITVEVVEDSPSSSDNGDPRKHIKSMIPVLAKKSFVNLEEEILQIESPLTQDGVVQTGRMGTTIAQGSEVEASNILLTVQPLEESGFKSTSDLFDKGRTKLKKAKLATGNEIKPEDLNFELFGTKFKAEEVDQPPVYRQRVYSTSVLAHAEDDIQPMKSFNSRAALSKSTSSTHMRSSAHLVNFLAEGKPADFIPKGRFNSAEFNNERSKAAKFKLDRRSIISNVDQEKVDILNADRITMLEAHLLGTIAKKVRMNLEKLLELQKKHREYKNTKLFKIESNKTAKALKLRSLRETRLKLPVMQEKVRVLRQYLNEDSKLIYAREKQRSNHLLSLAFELKQRLARKNIKLQHELEDHVGTKNELIGHLKETKEEFFVVRSHCHKLSDDVDYLRDELDKLLQNVEKRRKDKLASVQRRVLNETGAQAREIEVLMKAVEKRRALGAQVQTIQELDALDLGDNNLFRLPLAQVNVAGVKHVNVENNRMRTLEQLEEFLELESLIADNNELRTINFQELANLKSLSVKANQLESLEGIGKNLQYLNASSNKFTSLKGLTAAPDLRVLILSNSLLRDITQLKFLRLLLYLDMSYGSFTEQALEEVTSPVLLYLDASNNLIRNFPDIQSACLFELRLNENLMVQLSRTTWLFNLRILSIASNKIQDIAPLAMCPFLRELYLSNNLIREFYNIYNISICQDLEILDISGNPVNGNTSLFRSIGTLFPKMKLFNDFKLDLTHYRTRLIYVYQNPLKAAGMLKKAKEHFYYSIDDYTEIDYQAEVIGIWKKLAQTSEKSVENYLGKYYSPFLKYMMTKSKNTKFDPSTNLESQTRRMFWLTDNVIEMLKESEITPPASWNGSLQYHYLNLSKRIDTNHIIYAQSCWRMILLRRKYLFTLKQIIRIQRAYRIYRACIPAKALKHKLRLELQQKKKAAGNIQRVFRGWLDRKLYKQKVEEKRALEEEARLREEATKKLEIEMAEHQEIDEWLREDSADLFEAQLKEYLEKDELVHYPGAKRVRRSMSYKRTESTLRKHRMSVSTSRRERRAESLLEEEENNYIPSQRVKIKREVRRNRIGSDLSEDSEYSSDENEAGANAVVAEASPPPIVEPMINVFKTVQLAKQRHEILRKLSKQYHSLAATKAENNMNTNLPKEKAIISKLVPEGPKEVLNIAEHINMTENNLITEEDVLEMKSNMGDFGYSVKSSESSHLHNDLPPPSKSHEEQRKTIETVPELKEPAEESTIHDSDDSIKLDDTIGWNQYGSKTSLLLKQRQKRLGKMEKVAEERQLMKDPQKRLEVFQNSIAKMEERLKTEERVENAPIIRESSIKSLEQILERKMQRSKAAFPTIYEWDIHKGEPTQKKSTVPPLEIKYTGTAVQKHQENVVTTDMNPRPPVTLLINNYMQSQLLKVQNEPQIDPALICRVPPRKEESPGPFKSMLKLIPTKIVVPEAYGTYELTKHAKLPSINQ